MPPWTNPNTWPFFDSLRCLIGVSPRLRSHFLMRATLHHLNKLASRSQHAEGTELVAPLIPVMDAIRFPCKWCCLRMKLCFFQIYMFCAYYASCASVDVYLCISKDIKACVYICIYTSTCVYAEAIRVRQIEIEKSAMPCDCSKGATA